MKKKPRPLNIRTDFEFDFYVTRKNALTRDVEPATGIGPIVGRLALTKNGAVIGSCSASCVEAGTTGRYVGPLDTATMVTDLTAHLGTLVYAIPSKTGDLDCEWEVYRVVDKHQMSADD